MRVSNVSLVVLLTSALVVADDKSKTFTFSKADLGKVPAGWKAEQTGKGEASVWKVVEDKTSPSKSGYALAQTAEAPSATFNICTAQETNAADVEVSVLFRANEGKDDQGGGIVWRYQDSNNYYIARMNPLEDNFRVYKVVDGKRSPQFQNAEAKVAAGEWHKLAVRMVGDHIECSVNGKKYLEVKDSTFVKAGKVGLWTKADARTSFDNFVVKSLDK